MTDKMKKATRKLTDFNFDYVGAHVALVGPSVGGAANGHTTLLTKALNATQEEVEKASEVQVTMNIVDFLVKFFDLWYEDALVLAKVFGYDVGDADYSFEDSAKSYNDYLQERVDAIQVMKSVVVDKEINEIKKAVADLSSKDILSILKAQEIFEKNYESVVGSLNESSCVKAEGVTAPSGANSPSVDIVKQEEDSMSEFISKAAHAVAVQEEVAKAVGVVQAELVKAQEIIKQFEQEKAETIVKARKAAIATVEADEAAAEELLKSLETVPEETFEAVIKALKKKEEKVEQSDLMKELGTNGREAVTEAPVENKTAELLKKQFEKGAK